MKIVAIILTLNEEQHLERCINNLKQIANKIFVVDCYSTDKTVILAKSLGATVIQNKWVNHALQFNWALSQIDSDADWVVRVDADEYLSERLISELKILLPIIDTNINGIIWGRRIKFLGSLIQHGGIFPVYVLRFFRYGYGRSEIRWMDEHIKVSGEVVKVDGEMIDDNLNTLSWWIDKHNRYSTLEALDILNKEFNSTRNDSIGSLSDGQQASKKRWIKEQIYGRLPLGSRAFIYFIYRYFIRLGFLDGPHGLSFHLLQGFWYRFLVDQKITEVKNYMALNSCTFKVAIKNILNLENTDLP